ncbi:hypothetical protein Dred_1417 [Desulforamulus reducens MI-1]|uniref:Uncharacterized protein n=1 Tax=Desulforamulus reducens (strain ATCC BAA-1160 / DSM 100696 / MI-1) TaxID=349161 RepID=A4J4E4_DESRM|nr:hypothetical protein [Desulforamulus reducens]ABO49947.1 hypothetical protein Dred_1417 [Desulforamulus reducens MI-1]
MIKEKDFDDVVIPKSDTQSGPGLIRLKDVLADETNPLATFNEEG